MIIKLLGILDIIAALLFWLFGFFHIIPQSLIILVGVYLLAKGILFVVSFDIASMTDIIAACLILASLSFAMPKILIAIITIYLIQKGVLSLL
jgi:hypothetical protein